MSPIHCRDGPPAQPSSPVTAEVPNRSGVLLGGSSLLDSQAREPPLAHGSACSCPWAGPSAPGHPRPPRAWTALLGTGPEACPHSLLISVTPQSSPFYFCGNRATPLRRDQPRHGEDNNAVLGDRRPPGRGWLLLRPRPHTGSRQQGPARSCRRPAGRAARAEGGRPAGPLCAGAAPAEPPPPARGASQTCRRPPPQIPGAHAREDARAGAGKARPTPFAPRPARLPTALGGPGPAPSRGGQRACAVARAAVSSEGLKSAGHAQCSFWPWRGGRHIGTARGSRCGQRRAGYSSRRLRSSRAALASPGSAAPPFSGRPPALVPAAHAAAAGPRLSAAAGPGALRRGSGRRRGALAGP